MVHHLPTPVLSLASDALNDLDGHDALVALWTGNIPHIPTLFLAPSHLRSRPVFTRCKESLQDGRRLENISWRLWYRELATHPRTPSHPPPPPISLTCPLTPVSEKGSRDRTGKFSFPSHVPSFFLTLPRNISRIASRLPNLVPEWPCRFPSTIPFVIEHQITTTDANVDSAASVPASQTRTFTPTSVETPFRPPSGQDHMRYDPRQVGPRFRESP